MNNGFDHTEKVLAEAIRITREAAGVTEKDRLDMVLESMTRIEAKLDSIIEYLDKKETK